MDRQEAKRRREALDASLQDVASMANISDETVRKFENGGNVKPKYVDAIRAALESLETIQEVVRDATARQKAAPSLPDRLTRIEQDLAELKQLVQRLLDERAQ